MKPKAISYATAMEFRAARESIKLLYPEIEYMTIENEDSVLGIFWRGKKPSIEEIKSLIKNASYIT